MQRWEYRRILIINKSTSRIEFIDSLAGHTTVEPVRFIRTLDHTTRIANYLNQVGQDGWEIISHTMTDKLAEELVILKRPFTQNVSKEAIE